MKTIDIDTPKIEKALHFTGGNVRAAAQILGMSHQLLYKKIKRYGIDLDRFRD